MKNDGCPRFGWVSLNLYAMFFFCFRDVDKFWKRIYLPDSCADLGTVSLNFFNPEENRQKNYARLVRLARKFERRKCRRKPCSCFLFNWKSNHAKRISKIVVYDNNRLRNVYTVTFAADSACLRYLPIT